MIRKWIILFLFYCKMCFCFESYVNFDISGKNHMKKFPWMVTISGPDKRKLYAYGSLIHEKAVLTVNKINPDELNVFEFQVFAQCYDNLESELTYHCSKVRNIIRYNIIENVKEPYYDENFVVLILSKSFRLTPFVNIINLARSDGDYDRDSCIIMSLRHQINSEDSTQRATLISSTFVGLINRYDEIYHDFYQLLINARNGFKLTNDQNQMEEFIGENLTGQTLDYNGSPLVCKSRRDKERWLLVGVASFRIIFGKNELLYDGQAVRVDFNNLQLIFEETIKDNVFPGMKRQKPVLKYN